MARYAHIEMFYTRVLCNILSAHVLKFKLYNKGLNTCLVSANRAHLNFRPCTY